MEHVLYFRGVKCPEQLVKTAHKFAELLVGDKLNVLTDSSECVELILESVKTLKVGEVAVSSEDECYRVEIAKVFGEP